MTARYNGLADWYDARFVIGAPRHQPGLPELLGPGSGPCLDLGCGTGRNFDTIRDSGRTVVGVDRSSDQLRLARTRTDGPLIEVAPYWADDGIRSRVGMRHLTLSELLNAFLRPELTLELVEEPDGMPVPHTLALKARRN